MKEIKVNYIPYLTEIHKIGIGCYYFTSQTRVALFICDVTFQIHLSRVAVFIAVEKQKHVYNLIVDDIIVITIAFNPCYSENNLILRSFFHIFRSISK